MALPSAAALTARFTRAGSTTTASGGPGSRGAWTGWVRAGALGKTSLACLSTGTRAKSDHRWTCRVHVVLGVGRGACINVLYAGTPCLVRDASSRVPCDPSRALTERRHSPRTIVIRTNGGGRQVKRGVPASFLLDAWHDGDCEADEAWRVRSTVGLRKSRRGCARPGWPCGWWPPFSPSDRWPSSSVPPEASG